MLQELETITVDQEKTEEFASALRGDLITPADPDYEEACTIYNAMSDKKPAMIAFCEDTADVMAAVDFARENELELAVRGGGHNGAGLAMVDDGLVIDLSSMNGVCVDSEERTVRVEGGATWGEVNHATHAFGLAVPSGIISTTGVGGFDQRGATANRGVGNTNATDRATKLNILSYQLIIHQSRTALRPRNSLIWLSNRRRFI